VDLQATVKINRQILKLIASKHGQFFQGACSSAEARYYQRLKRDTIQGEEALKHGGLALPPDEDVEAGEL